jgi:RNA polymerase sigma-70 factor (ECF subfamily)
MGNDNDSLATNWALVRKIASPTCDEQTWTEFYGLYRRLVYGVGRSMGLSHDEAEDAVQDTMTSMLAKLPDFEADPGRGSFRSWLLKIARWRIGDVLRDRPARKPEKQNGGDDTAQTSTEERRPDPATVDLDALWEEQWKKSLYEEAVARVRQQVRPEQFQIFDFYVIREMPVLRVAKSLGVNLGSVYLARHRILKLIRIEVKRLQQQLP